MYLEQWEPSEKISIRIKGDILFFRYFVFILIFRCFGSEGCPFLILEGDNDSVYKEQWTPSGRDSFKILGGHIIDMYMEQWAPSTKN